VEAWVNLNSAPSSTNTPSSIINKLDYTTAKHNYYFAFINSKLTFGVFDVVTNNWQNVQGDKTSWTTGVWYHLVAVWDGSTVQFYVNGATDGSSKSFIRTPANIAGSYCSVGSSNGNAGQNLPGKLDEVAIYSTALSANTVQQHYGYNV
jgi:hypothetical protein